MKKWISALVLAASGSLLGGCGDVDKVSVKITFPDDAAKSSTSNLLFIVRQAPASGNGCAALWVDEASMLPQNASTIEYPYKNDVVAAPIDLQGYPALTLLIYAYPAGATIDVQKPGSNAIVAGCEQRPKDGAEELTVTLGRRTAS
jgi:hypothetical protein